MLNYNVSRCYNILFITNCYYCFMLCRVLKKIWLFSKSLQSFLIPQVRINYLIVIHLVLVHILRLYIMSGSICFVKYKIQVKIKYTTSNVAWIISVSYE